MEPELSTTQMRLAKALAFNASSRAKPELKPLALRVSRLTVRKEENVRETGQLTIRFLILQAYLPSEDAWV
jgi:hypothetical protein